MTTPEGNKAVLDKCPIVNGANNPAMSTEAAYPSEQGVATVEVPAQNEAATLLSLAADREALKVAVKAAQEALDENTTAIEKFVPGPEAGQKTKKISEDLKVIVKRELIYRGDVDGIREACKGLTTPDGGMIFPPIKVSESLDLKGYNWYKKNLPGVWAEIAKHVSAKPAKTSVEVKATKKK